MSKGMHRFFGTIGTVWCVSVLWSVSVGLGHLMSPGAPAEFSGEGLTSITEFPS